MKIIKFGKEAREALKKGVNLAADCVRPTLGPAGRNAVIGRHGLTPDITNDGVTIAQSIESDDETVNLGVLAVKEASMLADLKGGDGTTTATVLLQAIVNETFGLLESDDELVPKAFSKDRKNSVELKKEIDEAKNKVIDYLKKNKRDITIEEIYNVALVAGEYDWIAKLVSDIYSKIGKDGYVSIEEGVKSEFDVYKGIEIPGGYHSEYFVNNDKKQCVLAEPRILVTNQKLNIHIVLPIIEACASKNITNLIFIAPDFERDLLNRLNAMKLKMNYVNYVAVKLPTYDKDDILIDIATLSNARFFDNKTYPNVDAMTKEITVESLGKIDQAILGDGRSALIGGKGDTSARVEELKKQVEKTRSYFDRNVLEQRIAFLSGGIAVIRVGAESDTERLYFKRKIEDAVNAAQLALKEGVVPGGGMALFDAAATLPKSIITEALRRPYLQIQENAGGELSIGADIIDPVAITISSLESACSLAGMLLTTEVTVAIKDKDTSKNHADPER